MYEAVLSLGRPNGVLWASPDPESPFCSAKGALLLAGKLTGSGTASFGLLKPAASLAGS